MKQQKIYEAYKKKADVIMNFQLCRAYIGENYGMMQVVKKILTDWNSNAYNKDKLIGRALARLEGKTNGLVVIPEFNLEMTTSDILAKYVEQRFDKMVYEQLTGKPNYPLTFRDIIERNLQ